MASDSTSAYGDSVGEDSVQGEKMDTQDDTPKDSKDSTLIESKVSIIMDRKKVRISTKFTLPHGQNVFLAMKMAEAILDKTQKLLE